MSSSAEAEQIPVLDARASAAIEAFRSQLSAVKAQKCQLWQERDQLATKLYVACVPGLRRPACLRPNTGSFCRSATEASLKVALAELATLREEASERESSLQVEVRH